LKRNEVITIEPGVYLEGQWGMRLEDTIIVRGKPVVAASRAAPRALRAKGKR
jgi:Xaa-Pro aminopeptidase